MNTLLASSFSLPGQQSKYIGKVREVISLENDLIVMIATDKLSAFDVVMPKGIPYKGQILNQIATHMMEATKDIVPNWLEATPDPSVAVGKKCEPFKIEMVIRGYLSGHAAREYKLGKRVICGVPMPDGMIENDRFSYAIITPATKAEEGHDKDISREEIIKQGIVSEHDYTILEKYTKALFERGTQLAKEKGLILVDTKYEFGKTSDGTIVLIDEIHTPDSSRYFYDEGYAERQARREPQKQLSKEFVRQWLISKEFQGLEGQQIPEMSEEYIKEISDRYIELYEKITGNEFIKGDVSSIENRIEQNILSYLKTKQLN